MTETTTPTDADGRRRAPRDFTFVVPDDWFRLRLHDDHRQRDTDALVELLTAKRSDRDSLGPELREMVRNMTRFVDQHSIELYLSLTAVGGFPVACSLTVTLVEEHPDRLGAHDVVLEFVAATSSVESSSGELDGLPTGRRERRLPAKIDSQHSYDSIVVQHLLPIPGTTGFVLLDFSTPLVAVREPMIAIFDAIASSFRWVW
jgi:hypothetical protein